MKTRKREQERFRRIDQKQTRKLLLEMLDAFDAYTKKYGLSYYMAGGTALGAVRHQGFIPWDDDIDLAMPRPDYERFLALAGRRPVGKNLRVLSGDRGTLAWPYANLVNTDTRVKRKTDRYLLKKYRNPYLYIDIFPADGFPRKPRAKARLIRRIALLRMLLLHSRSKLGVGTSFARTLAKIPSGILARLIGMDRLNRRIIRLAKKIPYQVSTEMGILTNSLYGVGEAFDKANAMPFVKMKFEKGEYPIPACYDRYLTGIYGDYMALPPEEERKNHGMDVYIRK